MGLFILRSYSIEYTFLQFFNLLSYYPTQNPPFNLETTLPVTSQRCFAQELQAMANSCGGYRKVSNTLVHRTNLSDQLISS